MPEDKAIITPLDCIRYIAENREIPAGTVRDPQRLLVTYQRSERALGWMATSLGS